MITLTCIFSIGAIISWIIVWRQGNIDAPYKSGFAGFIAVYFGIVAFGFIAGFIAKYFP